MDLHHCQVTDDRLLVRLVDIPVHDHFIENVMDLLQIEHDLHVKELLNEKGSGYVQLALQVKEEDHTHQLGEIELQCLHKHVDEGKKGERILEWKQYPTIDLTAVDIRCNHVHQIVYELVDTSVSPMLEHIALV